MLDLKRIHGTSRMPRHTRADLQRFWGVDSRQTRAGQVNAPAQPRLRLGMVIRVRRMSALAMTAARQNQLDQATSPPTEDASDASGTAISAGQCAIEILRRSRFPDQKAPFCYSIRMSLSRAKQDRPILILLSLIVVSLVGLLLLPPIPQDQSYHQFADQRILLGIPNFWNVVSNLPFIAIGAASPRITTI
jgi:hypothetical protein